jgi:hypothetical protein
MLFSISYSYKKSRPGRPGQLYFLTYYTAVYLRMLKSMYRVLLY